MLIESKAATSEEMRDDIVKWLKYQASIKSSQARIAIRVKAKLVATIEAEAYEFAAKQIASIVIKS